MNHQKIKIGENLYYKEHFETLERIIDIREVSLMAKKERFLVRSKIRKQKLEGREAELNQKDEETESSNKAKREEDCECSQKKKQRYNNVAAAFAATASVPFIGLALILSKYESSNYWSMSALDAALTIICIFLFVFAFVPFIVFLIKYDRAKTENGTIKKQDTNALKRKHFIFDDVDFVSHLNDDELLKPLDAILFLLEKDVCLIPTVSQCIYASKVRYIKSRLYEKEEALRRAKVYSDRNQPITGDFRVIDSMTGIEFEEYCASVLRHMGYSNVKLTKASGDQGVDILAEKEGITIAVQCKRHEKPLSNTPVQEVFAGGKYYGARKFIVMTNSSFGQGATELANRIGVLLCDGEKLKEIVNNINSKAKNAYIALNGLNYSEREIRELAEKTFDAKTDEEKDDYFFESKIYIIDERLKTTEEIENYCLRFIGSYII